jgi:hypothetical protein
MYAFVRQRIWIQPWCLLWAGAVLGTAAPIWIDNFMGSATSAPEMYASIYGVPVLVGVLFMSLWVSDCLDGAADDAAHEWVCL